MAHYYIETDRKGSWLFDTGDKAIFEINGEEREVILVCALKQNGERLAPIVLYAGTKRMEISPNKYVKMVEFVKDREHAADLIKEAEKLVDDFQASLEDE